MSRTWWKDCLPNSTLEEATEEIGWMREDWQRVGEALGFTDFVDPEVVIARLALLAGDSRRYEELRKEIDGGSESMTHEDAVLAARKGAEALEIPVMQPEEINALPERVRRYIMWLETDADPAGTIRENFRLTEENKALRVMIGNGGGP